MKVRVSKVMAKVLAKAIQEYKIIWEDMTPRDYDVYVGGLCGYFDNYRAIKVIYPDSYYACPRYITTNDLVKAFKSSDGTLDSFIEQIRDMIEI